MLTVVLTLALTPLSYANTGIDSDGDDVEDHLDICPGYDDATALDTDHDRVCDRLDNCPSDVNPLQEDVNANDIGDVCEPDPCDGLTGQDLAACVLNDTPAADATCGDDKLDTIFAEECDNGDANADTPNAECRTDCTLSRCGDGIHDDLVEKCDDGNLIDGDGCDSQCEVEPVCSFDNQAWAVPSAPYWHHSTTYADPDVRGVWNLNRPDYSGTLSDSCTVDMYFPDDGSYVGVMEPLGDGCFLIQWSYRNQEDPDPNNQWITLGCTL